MIFFWRFLDFVSNNKYPVTFRKITRKYSEKLIPIITKVDKNHIENDNTLDNVVHHHYTCIRRNLIYLRSENAPIFTIVTFIPCGYGRICLHPVNQIFYQQQYRDVGS